MQKINKKNDYHDLTIKLYGLEGNKKNIVISLMEDILSLFPITNPFFFSNMEKSDYQVVLNFVRFCLYSVALFLYIFVQNQNPGQFVISCGTCNRVVIEQDDTNNLVSILKIMNNVVFEKVDGEL